MKAVTERELLDRLEWLERLAGRKMEGEPVVVFLHTPFCGTCAAARKMLHIVEHILPDVEILQADVNFLPAVVNRYQIRSVPALMTAGSTPNKEPEVLYRMGSVEDILNFVRRVKP